MKDIKLIITLLAVAFFIVAYYTAEAFTIEYKRVLEAPKIEEKAFYQGSSNPEVNRLLNKYFGEDAAIMHAIAKAESSGKQYAKSYNCWSKNGVIVATKITGAIGVICPKDKEHLAWSNDKGYFQIAEVHGYNDDCLYDLECNFKAAKKIRDSQGLTAWYTYRSGVYLKFLWKNNGEV